MGNENNHFQNKAMLANMIKHEYDLNKEEKPINERKRFYAKIACVALSIILILLIYLVFV